MKNAVLTLLRQLKDPLLSKQIADLSSELSESIFYIDKQGLWTDLLDLAYEFVSSDQSGMIQTGLNIYNYLFVHLASELSQFNDKFVEIFKAALGHPDLEVAAAALSAVCNYLAIAPSKYTLSYQPCLEGMVKVPLRAL